MNTNCDCNNHTITKKDLQIFRGTYAEVMAQPTVDMKIYLAWDTQQIFVGNKRGYKTSYNGRYKDEINAYLSNFKGEFSEEIYKNQESVIAEKINLLKDEIHDDIFNKIEASVNATAKAAAENAVGDLRNIATTNKSNIEKLESRLSSEIISRKNEDSALLNSLTEAKSSLDNEIKRTDALSRDISANTSNISIHTEKIEDLSNKVKNINTGVAYKTGKEIAELAKDIENFTPVFCTESYDRYSLGKLYYKDGSTIEAMAGGSTIKNKIDAGISISTTPNEKYIPMKDTETEYTFRILVAHPEALESMSMDGKQVIAGEVITKKIKRQTAGKTQITIVGTPKPATDKTEYTANSVSDTITVYQPWFFGPESNITQCLPSTKSFSASVNNEAVVLYATVGNLTFKSGGFEVPMTLEENISYNIDGSVSGTYYKYTSEAFTDDSFKMEIA